jgi:hypothetical protein
MTIAGAVFTVARLRGVPKFPFWRTLLLEIFIGSSLTALAALTWRHINHSFFKWIVRGYDIDSEMSGTETIEEAALAVSFSETNKAETKKVEAN